MSDEGLHRVFVSPWASRSICMRMAWNIKPQLSSAVPEVRKVSYSCVKDVGFPSCHRRPNLIVTNTTCLTQLQQIPWGPRFTVIRKVAEIKSTTLIHTITWQWRNNLLSKHFWHLKTNYSHSEVEPHFHPSTLSSWELGGRELKGKGWKMTLTQEEQPSRDNQWLCNEERTLLNID